MRKAQARFFAGQKILREITRQNHHIAWYGYGTAKFRLALKVDNSIVANANGA